MKKTWRKLVKTFFSFQRSDRNAILILALLIVVVYIAKILLGYFQFNKREDFSEIKAYVQTMETMKEEESRKTILFDFDPNTISPEEMDTLAIPQNVKQNLLRYRKAGGTFKTVDDVQKIYGMNDSIFTSIKLYIRIKESTPSVKRTKPIKEDILHGSFDPNSASEEELKKYGFNKFQLNNLVKYRRNGGTFEKASDLLKIYGIDSVFYYNISKHINIKGRGLVTVTIPKEILRIELNSTDTTELVKLNGIGNTLASRIIKYGNLLGGYYSKHQLLEVYGLDETTFSQIHESIYVDTLSVSTIRINFADYSELIKHPYLGKKEVNRILDHRQKNGPFKEISELCKIEGFDSEMITQITPYLSCR